MGDRTLKRQDKELIRVTFEALFDIIEYRNNSKGHRLWLMHFMWTMFDEWKRYQITVYIDELIGEMKSNNRC